MAYLIDPAVIADRAVSQLNAKPRRAHRAATEYQQAVFEEIAYSYYVMANMEQVRENRIPFNLTRVRHRLGRYSKKNLYWWDWLNQEFPMINIIQKGNKIQGVVSMVEPQMPINVILASGDSKQLVRALYSKFDLECDLHFAPINVYSLQNYILATQSLDCKEKTYQDNLRDAKTILMIAGECNNQLPQVVNHSAFGRTYYRGINLQSVHKTVRHAALGACYSVDINAAVFNWKYAQYPDKSQLTYTRELIQDKNRIRKHLARVVFGNTKEISVKTIKRVLTAISFGAKESGKGMFFNKNWTPNNGEPKYISSSVDTIIRSPELRTALFADPWMREFMREQKLLNDYIYQVCLAAKQAGKIPQSMLEDLQSRSGRISQAKFVAWAYQHGEQEVMAALREAARADVLLQVHDGMYFKSKPDMASMNTVLQDFWPLATLSIEQIDNYYYRNRELDQQHLDFIREQELIANDGVDPRTTGIHTETVAVKQYDAHSEPDWDNYMEKQMEEYYEHFPSERPVDSRMPEFARKRLGK